MTYYPTHSILPQVKDSIASYHYYRADKYVHEAREENRSHARNAFEELQKAKNYNPNFLDIKRLSKEMLSLGTINILIDSTITKTDHPITNELLPLFLKDQQYPFQKIGYNTIWIQKR